MEDNKQTSNAPVEDNVPEELSIVETKIGGYVKNDAVEAARAQNTKSTTVLLIRKTEKRR